MKYLLCMLIFFSSLASAEDDIFGFQGFKWGMSSKEIEAVEPAVVKSDKSTNESMYTQYQIPNYKVGDSDFLVSFYQDNKTNQLVRITLIDKSKIVIPDTTQDLLLKKYGKPVINKRRLDKYTTEINMKWSFKSTNVSFLYLNVEGKAYSIITYESKSIGDEAKL